MKFIKNKKILGLRLGDLAVLLLVCGLVVLMVKHFKRQDEWKTVKVKISGKEGWFVNPPHWLGEALKVGLIEKSVDGETMAEITRIENYERGDEDRDLYLTVRVKGVQNETSGIFSFKSRPLQVGKEVEFNFPQARVSGIVIADENKSEKDSGDWFQVKMRWSDINPWQAEALREGLVMRGDTEREYIAKVIKVRIEPAKKSVTTDRGIVVVGRDPIKKDAVIEMELWAQKHGDEYYFGGHQKLKVGEPLWVYFPEVDVDRISFESFRQLSVMEVERMEQ